MAIIKMKRVTVIAAEDLKDSLLKELMWLSSVDIIPLAEKLGDPEWSALLKSDGEAEKTSFYLQKVNELNQAMELLAKYSTVKKSLLTPRYLLSRKDFDAFEKDNKSVFDITAKVSEIKKEAVLLKNQQNKLLTQKQSLLPWRNYPIQPDSELTANTKVFLGILPNDSDFSNAASEIAEAVPASYAEKLSEDSEQQYIAVICHKSETENILPVLSRLHFSSVSFKGILETGTISDNIERITAEISALDKQLENQTEVLKKLSDKLPDIEKAYDIINNQLQLYSIRERLLKTHSVFMLDGWLPEKKITDLNEYLTNMIVIMK
jgi:V/A-type H+-transporting ATPase subunit I